MSPPPASSRSPSVTSRACWCWTTASTSSLRALELVAELLAGQPRRLGARHEPRTARCAGRGHVARALAALPRARTPGPDSDAVAVRRRRPVHRSCLPGAAIVRRERHQRARRRRDLPPSRRHPAGHRAGRGPLPADVGRSDRRRARRPLPPPHRRSPHGPRPPADARRFGGLELRPARRGRADHRSVGSACSPARSPSEAAEHVVAAVGGIEHARGVRPGQPPRRQEPRRRRRRAPRRTALPAPGDPARLRTRSRSKPPASCRLFATPTPPGGRTGSNPAVTMPTDDVLEEIGGFHANLKAALDWNVDRPPARPHPSERSRPGLGRAGTGWRRDDRGRPAPDRRERRPRCRCLAGGRLEDEQSRLRCEGTGRSGGFARTHRSGR